MSEVPPLPVFTVYTKPGCMPCRATINQLERHGVPFFKVDVTEDPDALERITSLGFKQSPVVIVTHQGVVYDSWSGMRPDRLTAAINHYQTVHALHAMAIDEADNVFPIGDAS